MDIRAPEDADIERLVTLWYDGWRDAHLQIVPAELTRLRTRGSLRDRHLADVAGARVVGPVEGLSDSRFYEKCGWRRAGTMRSVGNPRRHVPVASVVLRKV